MRFGYLALALVFVAMAGFAVASAEYGVNVTLTGPPHGNWNSTVTNLNFTYTPLWDTVNMTPGNCTLYTNASGTWAQTASNATTIVNNSINGILFTMPTNGTINWNVNCTTTNGMYQNYSSNGAVYTNFTVNIDNSQPIVTIISPTVNHTYVNRTTAYGGWSAANVGNTTFSFNVTGINATHGANKVNCSVTLGTTANHTNATTTAFGATRIDYAQIPANQTTMLNITCETPSKVVGSNVSLYYRGWYNNPLVNQSSPLNQNWTNTATVALAFYTNQTLFYNTSEYLNCTLHMNTTYNQTNSSVYPQAETTFTVSTGAGWDGWWFWNVTCKDVAGNIGYNHSYYIGLDRSVNVTWMRTNHTGYTAENVLHSAYWTNVRNLSGYIFSSNYSGTWTNDSWTELTTGGVIYLANYSNVTKTVSGDFGQLFGWRVWANDSLGNWGDTGIQYTLIDKVMSGGGGTTPTATPAPTPTSTPVPTTQASGTPAPTTLEIPTPTASETPGEEPIEIQTGMTEDDAQMAIADAEAALASPVAGADVARAQQELTLATQFMEEGDYDSAVGHAREAVRLANTVMPAATVTPSYVAPVAASGGSDWLLYAVVILVLAGAGYYFFGRPKKGL